MGLSGTLSMPECTSGLVGIESTEIWALSILSTYYYWVIRWEPQVSWNPHIHTTDGSHSLILQHPPKIHVRTGEHWLDIRGRWTGRACEVRVCHCSRVRGWSLDRNGLRGMIWNEVHWPDYTPGHVWASLGKLVQAPASHCTK